MLWTVLFVLVSFFSIIGVMEFVMCIMEMIATRTTKSLKSLKIVADIEGNEPNVEFVLSSLKIMADRIAFRNVTTQVCVCDAGVDEITYQRLVDYINENSDIYLIEKEKKI